MVESNVNPESKQAQAKNESKGSELKESESKGESLIKQVRKRDGRLVPFNKDKIVTAIFKAARAVGGREKRLARKLSEKVVEKLENKFGSEKIPGIEDVQDAVEEVLVEEGHAKTAKAYILYRRQRAELREEKKIVLEKDVIDEVDKQFDLNALRVLKARYLRKDERGRLIESPKQLFTRVAVHAALPELLYDERVFDASASQEKRVVEAFNPREYAGKLNIGFFALNEFHLRALKRAFDRFASEGKMKVSWSEFLKMLEDKEFDAHEARVREFYELMVSKKFLPNTPALVNFGNRFGMGSACFVLSVDDSIESIMRTLANAAKIFQSGGGVGYNFSRLRPEGDVVRSTSGVASGPITFIELYDKMTEVIKQGGVRRGANMGILNSNHPDIEKFIVAKKGNKALLNFNISVMLLPGFWDCFENNKPYPLVNPRNGQIVRSINARELFDLIVYQAWESAEPGVLFFDRINEFNPFLEALGPIECTNPCSEVLLYPNESCNLGSINVWAFVCENEEGESFFDWEGLKKTVALATRFLDNVIDINNYPLPEIEKMTLATRKIGLGVMGVGDLLYELQIPYNSEEGRAFMEQLMEFVNFHSKLASIELARERGPLPLFEKSFYPQGKMPFSSFYDRKAWRLDWNAVVEGVKKHGIRNGFTTVIAPTGSISMIAGCSSGIEPVYSLVFEKNVKVGTFYYIDPVFEKVLTEHELYDNHLLKEISDKHGSIQNVRYIPQALKKVFVTAHDITPEDHIRVLAAFQKWVDSSISKTNNFPADASVEDMRKSYLLAYKLGCKGVTVYRDSSIKNQVLVTPASKKKEKETGKQEKEHGRVPARGETEGAKDGVEQSEQRETLAVEPRVVERMIPVLAQQTSLNATTVNANPDAEAGEGMRFASPSSLSSISTKSELIASGLKTCPDCGGALAFKEGCVLCSECGWGLCKGG